MRSDRIRFVEEAIVKTSLWHWRRRKLLLQLRYWTNLSSLALATSTGLSSFSCSAFTPNGLLVTWKQVR
tara:strand:+ start:1028 stop:1234 length:207 start_codon:yes stop_codon:yes gene_type:complete